MNLEMTRKKRLRIKYGIVLAVLLFIEVLIALYVHDSFIRPYVGDMLVVMVIYCFIRVIIPDKCRLLPFYIFIFASGVEALQYFKLVQILGLENNTFMRTLIGSVFDMKDILCYGIGCMILGIIELVNAIIISKKIDNSCSS